MAILIRPPSKVLKRKSLTAKQLLEKLEQYINENIGEPVEILCSFWKDQQDAITYKEIREAIRAGYLDESILMEWSQDYSNLVVNAMAPLWLSAMPAGASAQPLITPLQFSFDTQTPGVLNWINNRGAEFVTSCTRDQRKAIAALLQRKITENYTVDELSRLIRPCIGLTNGQSVAVSNFYNNIKQTLIANHPRMSSATVRQQAMRSASLYAERLHRQRALTIAQTELEFAYNRGADEGIRQAQAANLIGVCVKKWISSGDSRVCPTCSALDGTVIEMDGDFELKGRLLFSGHHQLPPAHPRCGCAVEYVEISPPVF